MKIYKFKDAFQTAEKLADFITKIIKNNTKNYKKTAIALSGGMTASYYLSLLAHKDVDWNWVHFFWIHERMVSPDSSKSNFKMVQQTFFDKIRIPHNNIHRIKGELKNNAKEDYEKELLKYFGSKDKIIFDIVLLGLNENGYISSFHPDYYNLFTNKENIVIILKDKTKLQMARITLSLEIINRANNIIVYAFGLDKQKAFSIFLKELKDKSQKSRIFPILNKKKLFIFSDI